MPAPRGQLPRLGRHPARVMAAATSPQPGPTSHHATAVWMARGCAARIGYASSTRKRKDAARESARTPQGRERMYAYRARMPAQGRSQRRDAPERPESTEHRVRSSSMQPLVQGASRASHRRAPRLVDSWGPFDVVEARRRGGTTPCAWLHTNHPWGDSVRKLCSSRLLFRAGALNGRRNSRFEVREAWADEGEATCHRRHTRKYLAEPRSLGWSART